MTKFEISFNPFGAGRCLSTAYAKAILNFKNKVSIPLEQGGVFRRSDRYVQAAQEVSIPLEQGGVFRPIWFSAPIEQCPSQSL